MAANHQQNKGSTKQFGRDFMRYVASKLPYAGSVLSADTIAEVNPTYKHFYNTGSRRENVLAKYSVSRQTDDGQPEGSFAMDQKYHDYMYANVDVDKGKRLMDYRVMSAYAEVGDALDEICDSVIVEDQRNDIVSLKYKDTDFSPTIINELDKEFKKIAGYYDLHTKGWEYFRSLLVDGEVFFEHIIHEDHKESGILGLIEVPTELVDPIYDNVQNMLIKGYLLRQPVINPKTNTVEKYNFIPFDKHQMCYVHSGIWNEDSTMRLPFIENCRRSYRQLTMMEDAVVVHRLVRSPERLMFNVDVGNLAPPKAEAYLKKLMHNYFNKKTYDANQGGRINAFDPQSMLDSYWFAKRQGSDGSSVQSLQQSSTFDNIEDLNYFVKKLYKSLHIPVGRLDSASIYDDGTSMLRDELKFARTLIRFQQKFATSLKDSFVTHLKLKNLWEEFDMKEHHFEVVFNPPSNFYTLRESQIMELKTNNFTNIGGNESVSQTYAMKKYLDWNDREIKQNREWLRKDKQLAWELAQIETLGPNWREQLDAQAEGMIAEPGATGGDMGGGMLGGTMEDPPAFGGAAPDAPLPDASGVETAPEAPPVEA
jgi:hypothetical protein